MFWSLEPEEVYVVMSMGTVPGEHLSAKGLFFPLLPPRHPLSQEDLPDILTGPHSPMCENQQPPYADVST